MLAKRAWANSYKHSTAVSVPEGTWHERLRSINCIVHSLLTLEHLHSRGNGIRCMLHPPALRKLVRC